MAAGQRISGLLSVRLPRLSCVIAFFTLFQHADNAQQAFSTDQASTLHLAIPALEALHRAWTSRADHPKYKPFALALGAACSKIDDYYEKTAQSPAYIMSMSTFLTPPVNSYLITASS
jgi:hypothetical protein